MADAAFTSRPYNVGNDLSVFYRHVDDDHLDPHPQYLLETDAASTYRLQSELFNQADMATGLRLHTAQATAPTATRGDTWVDTDTMELFVYYGATTGWRYPWGLPWGYVGSSASGSNQTGIGTSGADITSATVTFTAVGNRRYRISAQVRPFNTSVATTVFLHIRTGTNTDLEIIGLSIGAGSQGALSNTLRTYTPAAGSQTVKLYAVTSTGTTDIASGAWIMVEDIGPSSLGTAPSS